MSALESSAAAVPFELPDEPEPSQVAPGAPREHGPADAAPVHRRRVVTSVDGDTAARRRWLPPLGAAERWADALGVAVAGALLGAPAGANIAAALVALVLLSAGGLYRPRLTLDLLADAPRVAGRLFLAVFLASLVGQREEAVGSVLTWAAAASALAVSARAGLGLLASYLRRNRLVAHPAVVVGGGSAAETVERRLLEHPECGLVPVAAWDPGEHVSGQELADLIDRTHAEAVILAFVADESKMPELIRACDEHDTEIFVVPRLYEFFATGGTETDHLWELPLTRLGRVRRHTGSRVVKRAMDLVLGTLLLVALLPVWVACAVVVLAENGRPLFFRQVRIGAGGRTFEIVKFRTMRWLPTAGDAGPSSEWVPSQEHVRIGPFSRILRALSLDELPQLWNVVKGDMSLVGPRPERPEFVAQFSEELRVYRHRHRVTPGMTGLAQVRGLRGDTSISERVAFDNRYIETWSVQSDLEILLRTIAATLTKRGS